MEKVHAVIKDVRAPRCVRALWNLPDISATTVIIIVTQRQHLYSTCLCSRIPKNSTRHPLMLVNLQSATGRLPPPRSLHKTCRRQIVFFFLAFRDFTVRFLDTIGYMHCFVIYLFAPIVIAFFLFK